MVAAKDIGERPLVVAIGGGAISIMDQMGDGKSYDRMWIDTDRRSKERNPAIGGMLLGNPLLSGEGCGGNMNLGRAVFREGMGPILERISNNRPIVILAAPGGGTGVAGAVEISTALKADNRSHFNLLLGHGVGGGGGMDPAALADLLLSGPLFPGAYMEGRGPDMVGSGLSEGDMASVVQDIAAASSPIWENRMEMDALSELSSGTPLSLIYLRSDPEKGGNDLSLSAFPGKVVCALGFPEGTSEKIVLSYIDRLRSVLDICSLGVHFECAGDNADVVILGSQGERALPRGSEKRHIMADGPGFRMPDEGSLDPDITADIL